MGEEIKYRYCMTCKVKYKATDDENQICTKCGALLADTPTGARKSSGSGVVGGVEKSAPKAAPAPKTQKVTQVEMPSEVNTPTVSEAASNTSEVPFTCTFGDILLCLLHNVLTGIPFIGMLWCGFSAMRNPLKGRVSKGTIVAGFIANLLSVILIILMFTVFKG